jgi:hypothetical protein
MFVMTLWLLRRSVVATALPEFAMHTRSMLLPLFTVVVGLIGFASTTLASADIAAAEQVVTAC